MKITDKNECGITGDISEKKDNLPLKDITDGKISGIYKIVNKANGKYYVGSSADIKSRWNEHKSGLNRNCHRNDYLQKSWNKHGKENFDFLIIKMTPPNQLITEEQKYLNKAKTEQDKCYNLTFDAFLPSTHLTPYSRHKISLRSKQLWKNEDFRKKMIEVLRRPKSEEHKKKIGDGRRGKKHTAELKNKLREMNLGKKHTDESKVKTSNSLIKFHSLPENKRDKNVYRFENVLSKEIFVGTKYEFLEKFNLNAWGVCDLVRGKYKSHKNWTLLPE